MNFYDNDDDKEELMVEMPTEHQMFRALFATDDQITKDELRTVIKGFIAATAYWHTRATLYKALNPVFLLVGFLLGYWLV